MNYCAVRYQAIYANAADAFGRNASLTGKAGIDSVANGLNRSEGRQVSELSSEPVSALLAKWQAGDEEAFRALVLVVYNELRRLAHRYLRNERPNHTLQSTALCTKFICVWPNRSRLVSRTALISWPFPRN